MVNGQRVIAVRPAHMVLVEVLEDMAGLYKEDSHPQGYYLCKYGFRRKAGKDFAADYIAVLCRIFKCVDYGGNRHNIGYVQDALLRIVRGLEPQSLAGSAIWDLIDHLGTILKQDPNLIPR